METELNRELAKLFVAAKIAKPGSSGLGLFGSGEKAIIPDNISSESNSSECLGV